jgi:hypothetical protein
MTYTIEHPLHSHTGQTTIRSANGLSTARFRHEGSLAIEFPGRLDLQVRAEFLVRTVSEPPDGGPAAVETQRRTVPCRVEIRSPDGILLTGEQVTMRDLLRFRDLQGVSHGTWTFKVSGESEPVPTDENFTKLLAESAFVVLRLVETITPKNAPPLVDAILPASERRSFGFDLWRVGTFVATAETGGLFAQRRAMKLRDPQQQHRRREHDGPPRLPGHAANTGSVTRRRGATAALVA